MITILGLNLLLHKQIHDFFDRISSVGRALDCREGGRGFDSRGWAITPVLKIQGRI